MNQNKQRRNIDVSQLLKDYLLPVAIALFGFLLSWAQIKSSQIQSAENIQAQFFSIYYQDVVKNNDRKAIIALIKVQKRLEEQTKDQSLVDELLSKLFGYRWEPLSLRELDRPEEASPSSIGSQSTPESPTPIPTLPLLNLRCLRKI